MTKAAGATLLWFRRDLRLGDHPALCAALRRGRPVIAVFILDPETEALGAAPKWRLGAALAALSAQLNALGSRLILRRGAAGQVLRDLLAQSGADAVYWSRLYDPASTARDRTIKSALRQSGVEARSFGGHVMFEPWQVETKTGGYYRVFTPFWKAVRGREVDAPLKPPAHIPAPDRWPASDALERWHLGAAMRRGAQIVQRHARIGEQAAMGALRRFIAEQLANYPRQRDLPAEAGTSGLSENLSLGEISPHQCWHAALRARHEGAAGAEVFLKELVWREFAYHLMHHTPRILDQNWKAEWDSFAWRRDPNTAEVIAWQRGRTGFRFVDAAMREMYVTGNRHNRGRMIVASFLTKQLLTDWRIGQEWFAQCLTDWDPASNAMGWQWAAGSGPDAAPYFRIFNPETQRAKFDPGGHYVNRWIAEGQARPGGDALSYFDAIPHRWQMDPAACYPAPVVGLAEGRQAALDAYAARGA